MRGITQLYGRQDDQRGEGDERVADLLRRTTTGQFLATEGFEAQAAKLRAEKQSPFSVKLPVMSVLYAQWLAAVKWQMATAFLDAMVVACERYDEFPEAAYRVGDALCDDASLASRTSVQLMSKLEKNHKVKLSSPAELPSLTIDRLCYPGIWAAYEVVMGQVESDYEQVAQFGDFIPSRMRSLFQGNLDRLHAHSAVFDQLRRDKATTTMAENQLEIVTYSLEHVRDVFVIGQELWAPYLLGQAFAGLYRSQPSLEDLVKPGFDPWCLTDPAQEKLQQADDESRKALAGFWGQVDDLDAAIALVAQVNGSLKVDAIRRRTGRGYSMMPWPSQFLVRRSVTLGSRTFALGDLIAYYVSSNDTGKLVVDVRRTGRLGALSELLGQYV